MRLRYVVLLAAAAVLTSVDATIPAEAKMIRLAADEENGHAKRLLGSYTFADADEERGFLPSKITNFFKSKDAMAKVAAAQAAKVQAASKLSKTYYADEAIQPLIKSGASLDDAFAKLSVQNVGLDKLIGSRSFNNWFSYMTHFNTNNRKDAMTVTQFLRTKYSDKQVAQMLLAATKSSDAKVQQMGAGLQLDLLKQFVKTNKSPDEVAKLLPSLTKEYNTMVAKAVEAAKAKAADAAKYRQAALRRGVAGRA